MLTAGVSGAVSLEAGHATPLEDNIFNVTLPAVTFNVNVGSAAPAFSPCSASPNLHVSIPTAPVAIKGSLYGHDTFGAKIKLWSTAE